MGNNNGKKNITKGDMEFLRENTAITKNDLAMYDNFLIKHPDGTIARKEFRLIIILFLSFIREIRYIILTFQHYEAFFNTPLDLNSFHFFFKFNFCRAIQNAFSFLQS